VLGVSRLPFSRQGVTHASGRNSHGSYPQSLTVVKGTRRVIPEAERKERGAYDLQGVWVTTEAREDARVPELERPRCRFVPPSRPFPAPRHEIRRQRGAARDRYGGFCNADRRSWGFGNRFGAHDVRTVGVLIIWAAH
jgi:hypothetical protein